MKYFFTLVFTIIISQISHASEFSTGVNHKIQKDKFAKSGQVKIQYRDLESIEAISGKEKIEVLFDFKFRYGVLVFRGNYEGQKLIKIPASFKTEEGYLLLEQQKFYEDDLVILRHLGRKNILGLYDCHYVELIPKTSTSGWSGRMVSCPDLPELGIGQMELTVRKIPVLGDHTLTSTLSP